MLWSAFFSFLLINGIYSEEPHCSRFHYDDQLLEKMIRMEVKVEAMEKVILNANKQMLETQDEVQESLDALKSERAELRSDYADLKTKLMDDFKFVKDTLLTPTIVFKARNPVDISLETSQTVVFSNTMINDGDAYDNVTGVFTAPVGGAYLFTVHFCVQSSQSFYYGIIRDNSVETSGRFYGKSTDCHTADAILVLEARQKVWVKCLHGGTSNVLYEYNGSHNYWNTFSGVLIHK